MVSLMHSSRRVFTPVVIAALGDAVLLIVFAVIGRASHGESGPTRVGPTLATAAPFLAGWFVAASLLGAFSTRALSDYRAALVVTLRSWLLGGIIALLLRSIAERRIVPASFAVVALLFNAGTLSAWRLGLVSARRRV